MDYEDLYTFNKAGDIVKTLSPLGKKILAGAILVVLAAVVTVTITFAGLDSTGPKRLVKTYVNAINDMDFDQFVGCFPPSDQKVLKEEAKNAGGGKAFFERNYKYTFEQKGITDFGDNITVTVSGMEAEKQKIEGDVWNGVNVKENNYSAITVINCNMSTKGSKAEESQKVQIICAKIEGHWYILSMVAQ